VSDSGVWPSVDLGGPARGPLHYMFLRRPDLWAYFLNIFSSHLLTNQSAMLELASLANKSSFEIQQLRKQARSMRDELSSRVRIDETLEKELGAVVTGTNTLCKWDQISSQIKFMSSSTLTAFINWCGEKLECVDSSASKQAGAKACFSRKFIHSLSVDHSYGNGSHQSRLESMLCQRCSASAKTCDLSSA